MRCIDYKNPQNVRMLIYVQLVHELLDKINRLTTLIVITISGNHCTFYGFLHKMFKNKHLQLKL